ncbi:hypothetical protein MTO96_044905 [Rhipicephalus appendiculatus]
MSGSVLSPWAISRDVVRYARLVGQALGCTESVTGAGLGDCLRHRPVGELFDMPLAVPEHLSALVLPWTAQWFPASRSRRWPHYYRGTKSKVRDHYHAHRLSVWIQLIPKLPRAGGGDVPRSHHLLEDFDDAASYDGVVREVPPSLPPMSPSPTPLCHTPPSTRIRAVSGP